MIQFIRIKLKASVLEESLKYIACPGDNSELRLDIPNRDYISEGEFSCTGCGKKYEIEGGIAYFSGKMPLDADKKTNRERENSIKRLMEVAIEAAANLDEAGSAERLQKSTRERYDAEIYAGTWKVPGDVLDKLDSRQNGIVVEGGCGPGDCLLDLKKKVVSPFFLGIDISGKMIGESIERANKNGYEDVMFVQGDVRSMPVASGTTSLYVVNNVWDRVSEPRKAAAEGGRILDRDGSVIFGNCQPMQFEYGRNGRRIIYVPENERVTLEEAASLAGCKPLISAGYSGKRAWHVRTILDGGEELPMKVVYGVRG